MAYPNLQFTVTSLASTTPADLILSPMPNRVQIWILNGHTTNIYLGSGTNLSDTNGFPLAAGASFGPLLLGYDPVRNGPRIFGWSAGNVAAGAIRIIEAAGPL